MEIACIHNEANKFYQEVNSIREGFKLQTLLFTDKESKIVNYKEKIIHTLSGYHDKRCGLQDGIHNGS